MKVCELVNDPLIIDWIDTLNPAINTKKLYLQAMQNYTDWTGKTLEELLTEAQDEIKSGKLMRQTGIKVWTLTYNYYMWF